MKIIINADDFGFNHDVNMAIVEAFERGLITNTTIMTNMPCFEEAVELSNKHVFFIKWVRDVILQMPFDIEDENDDSMKLSFNLKNVFTNKKIINVE